MQCILGVTRGELRNTQHKRIAEPNKSQLPMDSAFTAGAQELLDTNDVPIAYANINPTRCKLVHPDICPFNSSE